MSVSINLEQITAGQPLVAGKVARNFAAIQAFLASIPNDSLVSQYAPYSGIHFTTTSVSGASSTFYWGYMLVPSNGGAVSMLTVDVLAQMAGPIAADADGFTMTLEASSTPPGPSMSFSSTGVSFQFLHADAVAGALGGDRYFKTFDILSTPTIAGKWIRWKLDTGAVAVDEMALNAACKTRLGQ